MRKLALILALSGAPWLASAVTMPTVAEAAKPKKCKKGQELFKKKCVKVCKKGTARNDKGKCVPVLEAPCEVCTTTVDPCGATVCTVEETSEGPVLICSCVEVTTEVCQPVECGGT
jgi:hypothetical protein